MYCSHPVKSHWRLHLFWRSLPQNEWIPMCMDVMEPVTGRYSLQIYLFWFYKLTRQDFNDIIQRERRNKRVKNKKQTKNRGQSPACLRPVSTSWQIPWPCHGGRGSSLRRKLLIPTGLAAGLRDRSLCTWLKEILMSPQLQVCFHAGTMLLNIQRVPSTCHVSLQEVILVWSQTV